MPEELFGYTGDDNEASYFIRLIHAIDSNYYVGEGMTETEITNFIAKFQYSAMASLNKNLTLTSSQSMPGSLRSGQYLRRGSSKKSKNPAKICFKYNNSGKCEDPNGTFKHICEDCFYAGKGQQSHSKKQCENYVSED